MSFLSRLYDKRRTVASATTVSIFSTALVVLAVTYDGEPTADVELNDSGVWVTRTSGGELARFNYESQAIDGTLLAGSASFDVAQTGNRVLLADTGSGSASPIDIARLKFDGTAALPAEGTVEAGGPTAAVYDGETGLLWVMPFAGITSFDAEFQEPTAELGTDGELAVAQDGTVFVAVPAEGELTTVEVTGRGAPSGVETTSLAVSPSDAVSVTVVGDEPVILNRTQSRLVLPGNATVAIDGGDSARLQQPGPATETVAVATATGLVQQPLAGGDAQVRRAEGVPARPVQLGGCTYGAWSQSGQVLRDCEGTGRDLDMRLEGVDPQSRLEYRVNRDVIVLNDLAAGTLWMAADEFELVDDWDQTMPEQAEGEESDADDSAPEQVDQVVLDRSKPNQPPVPADDDFGVRPGRSTVLPVLANDVDPDGDVMTAELAGDQPNGIEIQQVMGGAALQAVVPDDATGTAGFRYTVDDGRPGGRVDASVSLRVVPWEENNAPEQTGEPVLVVEQGKSATIKVLPYFRDPDGDDLYLSSAAATVDGDEVRSRPDGTVEFRDGGGSTGRKEVSLTVVDSFGMPFEGRLLVQVSGAGQLPPIAVQDHVVVQAGEPVTIEPLRNDSDPNGDPLRLTSVGEFEPAEITPNYDAGTFRFLSNEPRSYDIPYVVTDGPNETTGLVRVDVLPPSDDEGAPIVVSDTALLPSGGSTLVDVLANDTDPAGGVLVVQSVRVPDDAGVTVAILGHQMLRVTEIRRLTDPVTVEYTVSNGTQTATGEVRVIPVRPPTKLQPPNAVADEATVRTGDVVSIPVLRNDTHPDGLPLFLQDEFEQGVDPEQGEIFVSEDLVRFKAGDEAGTVYAIYRVRDENGQEDSAQITIHIRDGEDNSPPQPRDIEARVLAGSSVRIAVPLDGIDPDGDSVQLTEISTQGDKGIARVDGAFIEYEAGARSSGADEFTYTLLDARGEVATGVVRVGIARPADTNQPPVAVDDIVTVRPERTVAVDALANDTDPDGDVIALVPGAIEDEHDMGAEVVGDRVVLTSPSEPGSYTFYYAIEDTYGARASAAITVEVDQDAPLLKPIARDDIVPLESILGQESVNVDVLANDDDPDGAASELEVTVDEETAVVEDDGTVTVTLATERQVLGYTITDIDGLTARAFVHVPGIAEQKPTLRPGIAPLEVYSGEELSIDITDYVVVLEGRAPRLTVESKVTAREGSREVPDESTIVYTSNDGYSGPASVSFEVTDGSGPDDPDGNTAVLTLPITVLPPENLPPELREPSVEVAAGEDASVDLGRFASDPDDDPLTFTAGASPDGLTVTVEGSRAVVQATPQLPKGTSATIPLTVSDGENPPVDGSLAVRVVASTRPLARANEDVVNDVHQGRTETVPVLANDSNPFPDTPLELVAAVVETGSGEAVVSGSNVQVTPNENFVGVMVVRYRIQDATQDVDREVEGRIKLTVLGRPDTPTRPSVEEVRSRTVVLSWTPPNNNGADITGYTVRSDRGYSKECATTTCTLDGLTNDVEYTFTVVATNDVGASEPSPASEMARPDEKPDPPSPPSLEFGDESLTVTWQNASYTDRSPIESVNLEIVPTPPSGERYKEGVTGSSVVWDGLANGTAYTVKIQAVNAAPDPSDWGGASAAEVPAGKPAAPARPAVTRTSIGEQSQMNVTWTAPHNNGADITSYTVQALRGDSVVQTATAGGGATSQTLNVPANTTDYTFRVRAHNKATDKFGEAEFSGVSNPVRAYAAPGAVSGLRATATGANGTVQLEFGNASGTGVRADEITYQYNAGGGWQGLAANKRVTGLTNGQGYAIQVRGVAGVDGSQTPGTAATANSVRPYGDIRVPGVSATKSGAQQVQLSWTDPGSHGRSYRVQIRINGGSWENVANSGSRTVGNGYDQTHSIQARAVETEAPNRTGTASATRSATTNPRPQPSARAAKGNSMSNSNCSDPTCKYVNVVTQNWEATGQQTVQCWTDFRSGPHQFASSWVNVPANGEIQTQCYIGSGSPNYAGHNVWVVINGQRSESVRW
ncbi:Ig-like domain-containing protein [Oerskovia flava]|uniref:Ig-like domain-containing protein n=1 Tax=Oerskovia flava TaxID=2986422 RepID=UPI00223F7246|nr:Ig-like domain-containing protein [Oerskovia sp. JB1-3-2]